MTGRLELADVEDLVLGATLLGSGGGGEAGVWSHRLRAALTGGPGLELLSLAEARSRGLQTIAPVGLIGATSVLTEKLPHGAEIAEAVAALERWTDRRVDAVMPVEAAGLNAALAVAAAGDLGLPLVDADLMGRALPRFDQLSLMVAAPGVITSVAVSETGGPLLVLDRSSASLLERAVRSYVSVAGGWAGAAFGPVDLGDLVGHVCEGTLARALRLGRTLREAGEHTEPAVLAARLEGIAVGRGRIVHLRRGWAGAPNRSSIAIGGPAGPVIRIEAENEYLVVFCDGAPVASCPDLVAVLDRRTVRPIAVDRLRLGDDVTVLAVPGPSWWWRSPGRLAAVGPRAFGIDLDPVPIVHHAGAPSRAGATFR